MTTGGSAALPELSAADRMLLLRTARRALVSHFDGVPITEGGNWPPSVVEPFATFVTLRDAATGELRGCRGEIRARQSLVDSVMEMAVASAVGDPRFEPVRAGEIEDLSIDISVLGPLRPIHAEEVEVGRHGLMISRGHRSGLLLPSVPLSMGWDRQRFLSGLCAKAGLPADAWRDDDVELLAFETVTWSEAAPGGADPPA